MSDKPDSPARVEPLPITVMPGSSERAPFIFFDGSYCFGTHAGVIQLELGTNVLMPSMGGARIDVLATAHLRCSPAAAISLREAIDKALGLQQQGAAQFAEPVGSKPN